MHPAARAALISIVCLVVGLHARQLPAQAPAADSDPVALAIASELDASMGPEATTIHGARLALQAPVQEFYSRRGFRPAWSNADNAAQLRKALADSYDDGLNPADYHLPLLEELSGQITQATATDVLRAQYDVLLTEALLRLAYHLSFGKVDPETFDAQWNYGRTLARTDVAQEVEQALAAADVYQRIEALKPTQSLYVELKRELARFRAAVSSADWPTIAAGAPLTTGLSDARVPAVRARLIASGDLAAAAASDSPIYDSALEAAVKVFQQRMGLQADGVAGAGTIAELNVPLAERIRQLRVNLDRGRVLLRDLPDEFVVVNIAGFTAHLVRARQFVWTGRVQVGKPYRRTPIFRSQLNYVVFNPTWTVPPGIIEKDILPAAKRDPGSITRKGLKVLDANGRELDPSSIDWSRFSGGHIPYTLRQDPGPSNALGRVKLMFPNPYFVYLHDTPSQALFERAERSFSSGCVRVERVLELTQLVLNDRERWNDDSIAQVLASGQTRNVTLTKSIPVLLTYWTAWVDPQGRLQFRRDIYGQDDKWAQALEAEFKLRTKPLFSTAAAP
jgi:murein L,D-transpeptidase YcbB/YkuD